MEPFLEIHGLRKSFGPVHAVDGIDLAIPGPGLHGFLGPNGAGKTTTIKLVAGLLKPDAGTITVRGIDARTDHVAAARQLGLMLETPPFYPHLNGRDNLHVLARLTGGDGAARIDGLLDDVGLARDAHRKVGGYSRGMRQRLGLAASLIDDPPLLVLDEPANGLDPEGIIAIRRWLPRLVEDRGKAILMSSHQLGEVEKICEHIHIISEGRICMSGEAAMLSGPTDTFDVRLPEAARWTDRLAALAELASVETTGDDRLAVVAPGRTAAQVTLLLSQAGAAVEEVAPRRETLEDVFLRVVEGS